MLGCFLFFHSRPRLHTNVVDFLFNVFSRRRLALGDYSRSYLVCCVSLRCQRQCELFMWCGKTPIQLGGSLEHALRYFLFATHAYHFVFLRSCRLALDVGEAQLPPVRGKGGSKEQQPGDPSLRAKPGSKGHGRAGNHSDGSRRRKDPPETGVG